MRAPSSRPGPSVTGLVHVALSALPFSPLALRVRLRSRRSLWAISATVVNLGSVGALSFARPCFGRSRHCFACLAPKVAATYLRTVAVARRFAIASTNAATASVLAAPPGEYAPVRADGPLGVGLSVRCAPDSPFPSPTTSNRLRRSIVHNHNRRRWTITSEDSRSTEPGANPPPKPLRMVARTRPALRRGLSLGCGHYRRARHLPSPAGGPSLQATTPNGILPRRWSGWKGASPPLCSAITRDRCGVGSVRGAGLLLLRIRSG